MRLTCKILPAVEIGG